MCTHEDDTTLVNHFAKHKNKAKETYTTNTKKSREFTRTQKTYIQKSTKKKTPKNKGFSFYLSSIIIEAGYANSDIWVGLFLPYSSGNPKFQLFLVPAREEKCHIPLYYKPIVAVPDFPVTIPYAPWGTLPPHLPSVPSYL